METKRMYAPKHVDGYYITIRCERTKSIKSAARFTEPDELMRFIYGIYGPDDPENFRPVPVKITYEEDEENADTESGTEESEIAVGHQRPERSR